MLKNNLLTLMKQRTWRRFVQQHQHSPLHLSHLASSSSSDSDTPASPASIYSGGAPTSHAWAHLQKKPLRHVQLRHVHRMLSLKQIKHINQQNGIER